MILVAKIVITLLVAIGLIVVAGVFNLTLMWCSKRWEKTTLVVIILLMLFGIYYMIFGRSV